MRLVSFAQKGVARYGLVESEGVIDLSSRIGTEYPTLRSLLAGNAVAKVADRFLGRGRADHALADIAFRPAIPDPDKILCVGLNYSDHIAETGRTRLEHPTLFVRFPNAQVGHGQPMVKPRESVMYDYEGEIAVVIGKAGRRIPRERAYDYIAGFSCYNDGSVRDFQRHSTQFTAGKNFVASGAFGPWLTTRDEIGDAMALTVKTRLNGIEMQHGSARDLIFPFDALVAYCSLFTELAPGDVIATGTPGGVGFARNPPVFMKPGDSVEVEVSGVGVLRNPISEG
jgi:2-keto-4-pentenoate hydratase/2-oxohepta-3-ene-1,7-dioic acid hydratase in catechol pathway